MIRFLLFFFSAYLLSPSPAHAAVISRDWKAPGDGLLTYDTVNQREWLDLTETQLAKFPGDTLEEQYQAVIAETPPGRTYHGFRVATEGDVRALAESAGIDTSILSFEANGAASSIVINFLGNTIDSINVSENTRSSGFVATANEELASVWIVFNPQSRTASHAGFRDLSGELEPEFGFFGPPPLIDTSGVWLFRQVPEPQTFFLMIVVLLVLVAFSVRCRSAGA